MQRITTSSIRPLKATKDRRSSRIPSSILRQSRRTLWDRSSSLSAHNYRGIRLFQSCNIRRSPPKSSIYRNQHIVRDPITQQTRPQYQNSPSSDESIWEWAPSFLGRLAAAFGMVHVVSEYGIELTLCEGPSMMPTIQPLGEIIIVDRLTPRLNGLHGGSNGQERAKQARKRQDDFEEQQGQDDVYEWHEPLIPANELPSEGAWSRLWKQLTTGISIGDVIVVQHPDRTGTVCKRVLGLPGDVVVRAPHQRNGRISYRTHRRDGLFVVPDGHVWIEGDNVLNSSDSRNYGPVPAALIVGRVLFRIWPIRGNAMMERGVRPVPPPPHPVTGTTILPAGYEGETIVRHVRY
mmetsp:Transcript_7555/g.11432  ORF Transcript_7555/g.11432 Transcript_7555/m.11432 type:complete len:349 (-) Transcript_7555:2575-3621(-)